MPFDDLMAWLPMQPCVDPRTRSEKGDRLPMPPPGFFDDPDDVTHYHAGVTAFNTGDHYQAHDHFEALWGEDFWKGLVQAAVALHHHRARNPKGIQGLPENVNRILHPYLPQYAGIDTERLLQEFNEYFQRIENGEDPPLEQAPRLHAPPRE
jgi:predicted metal-dependent hydrolase